MESKKRRGRPSITEKIAGSNVSDFEQVITNGKKYRSRRSIVDAAYAITAASILLSEAASDIDDLELICCEEYQCRSILNQLGRMYRQDGYSENDVIEIAKEAIKGKRDGRGVKEIEQSRKFAALMTKK
jgi:hypothetical protein